MKKVLFATLCIAISLFVSTSLADAKGIKIPKNGCAVDMLHTGFVDQEQCKSSGSLSARTNPYYEIWQSFTVEVSGELTEIDPGFEGPIPNAKGTLGVVEGEGVGGTPLGSSSAYVSCDGGKCVTAFTFDPPITVTEGNVYTFIFVPGYGMPDPYGIQIGAHNPYHKGTMGSYMPVTGTLNVFDTYDTVFTTFVR